MLLTEETYLKDVLVSILKEEVMQDDVIDAIKKRHEVDITYGNSADGRRRIQPVVYGTSLSGNPMIRAYQPYGDTESSVPSWKLFRLDRITNWKTLSDTTFDIPPSFEPNDDKFANIYVTATQVEKPREEPIQQTPEVQPQQQPTTKEPQEPVQQYQPVQQPKQYNNIAGLDTQDNTIGNQSSIEDMSSVGKIGDETTQPTTQPQTKDNVEDVEGVDTTRTENYTKAAENGPVIAYDTETEDNTEK